MRHYHFIIGNILILMGFLLAFGVVNVANITMGNLVLGFIFVIAGSYLDLHGREGR